MYLDVFGVVHVGY